MSLWALIWRELRTQARQPFTYFLRVLGGLAVAAACCLALMGGDPVSALRIGTGGPPKVWGLVLFGKINLFSFGAVWILGPLITADCLSRERREGTLSLLYLTNLGPNGIVIGKSLVQLMRALTLFATMAPWLFVPLLFGGVTLRDVVLALLLDFAGLLLAIAAGLLASTLPRDWLKAAILAEAIGFVMLLWMLHGYRELLIHAYIANGGVPPTFRASGGRQTPPITSTLPAPRSILSDALVFLPPSPYPKTTSATPFQDYLATFQYITNQRTMPALSSPAGSRAMIAGAAGLLAGAFTVFAGAIWLAGRRVRHSWTDHPTSAQTERVRKIFFSPRWGSGFRQRQLSAALESNPIGWLQEYSTSGRLVKWGWCLFLIFGELLLGTNFYDLSQAERALGTVLLLGMAASSTASFRSEIESGAFELLLVTPLKERQILWGRLFGLWKQFLPAMLIYSLSNLVLVCGWEGGGLTEETQADLAWNGVRYALIPFFGLGFSFCRINFLLAWLLTCLAAWGPVLIPMPEGYAFDLVFFQALLAGAACIWIEVSLAKRWFLKAGD